MFTRHRYPDNELQDDSIPNVLMTISRASPGLYILKVHQNIDPKTPLFQTYESSHSSENNAILEGARIRSELFGVKHANG